MRFLVRELLALPLVVTLTACGDVHPLPDRADIVVSRAGGAWPQFGSPDATPIDPDAVPRIE